MGGMGVCEERGEAGKVRVILVEVVFVVGKKEGKWGEKWGRSEDNGRKVWWIEEKRLSLHRFLPKNNFRDKEQILK